MSLNEFETDDQKAEALIEWLKQKGILIVIAIAVLIGGIVGWHYYKGEQHKGKKDQSDMFYKFDKTLSQNNFDQALFDNIQSTSDDAYQNIAGLMKANYEFENQQIDQAIETLIADANKAKDPSLKALTNLKLAQLYYTKAEYDKALSVLDSIHEKAFDSVIKELMGDIYVKQARYDLARAIYEEALSLNNTPYLQKKLGLIKGK